MKMFHEMREAVARKYGLENENTIAFYCACEDAETVNDFQEAYITLVYEMYTELMEGGVEYV